MSCRTAQCIADSGRAARSELQPLQPIWHHLQGEGHLAGYLQIRRRARPGSARRDGTILDGADMENFEQALARIEEGEKGATNGTANGE